MDFLEGLFGRVWKTRQQRDAESPHCVLIEDVQGYLKTIVNWLVVGHGPFEIGVSRWQYGFQGSILVLPQQVALFSSEELNRKLYLLLALKAVGTLNSNLSSADQSHSKISARIETLKSLHAANQWLDSELPGFGIFETEMVTELSRLVGGDGFLAQAWTQAYMARSVPEIDLQKFTPKRNDSLPLWLALSVPCLPMPAGEGWIANGGDARKAGSQKSELQKKTADRPKVVNLEEEKKKTNPVTHSFEKIETLDDYQGGHRQESGDDELQKHEKALDELDLDQVTISGETAQSIYQIESFGLNASAPVSGSMVQSEALQYPEWQASASRYLPRHCQVYERRFDHQEAKAGSVLSEEELSEVVRHKQRMMGILNQPLWRRRQSEGPEVDIDAAIRAVSDLKSGHSADGRLYMTKRKSSLDLDLVVLFDQSLSTDSWVGNTHVIDSIRRSILKIGMVFDDLLPHVLVAGTWSASRHNCEFQIYKEFEQKWVEVEKALGGVEPKGYTRLGPGIRHATSLLRKRPASRRMILLLTDGKPSDIDGYEGVHGTRDIKMACLEAEAEGTLVYGLAYEKKQTELLHSMFSHISLVDGPSAVFEGLFRSLLMAVK